VWLYYRFEVSLRDVSELMLARGIEVSHEAPLKPSHLTPIVLSWLSRLCRANIDVRVEEVLGIVFALEFPQPAVIGPVGGGASAAPAASFMRLYRK
jgi:hypothetical protein